MECKTCLIDDSIVRFKDGECEFCQMHRKFEADSALFDLDGFVEKLRKKKGYHCLIGISGGLDSSFMLEYTVKKLGLKPLVIHFDNYFNVPEANHNIETMIKALNVDCIRYYVDRKKYNDV